MEIDVFTLFPQWFEWFRAQRHVANVLAAGSRDRVRRLPRAHAAVGAARSTTRRSAAAPGMVLRVDVLDSALRARYGVDPVRAARAPARDRAGARRAAARRGARRRARRRARADAAVRPLRGLRRAHPRALRQRRGLDRPLRAQRRRAGGDGGLRRGRCASCPARSATSARRAEESFSEALEGNPEYPHYTRPAEYRGWRVPEVLLSGHHERIERVAAERSRERGARPSEGSERPADPD